MTSPRPVLLAPLAALWAVGIVGCGGSDAAAPADESWCEVVAASNALDDEFDAIDPTDPDALRSVLEKIDGLGARFRAAAPDELASQIGIYADTNDKLVGVFRDADFDVEQLDNEAVTDAIADVDGVETEIDVYTVAECGEPLGPDDT